MTYRRFEGEGKLRLNIQKRDQTAIVELDASSYAIKRTIGGNETTIVSGSHSGIGSGDGSRVEFTFVDQQATLRIDGKIVALDTPHRLKQHFNASSMDDVFYQLARGAQRQE